MSTRNVLALLMVGFASAGVAREKKIISCAWEWRQTGPGEIAELQPQIAAAGYDGIAFAFRYPHGEDFHSSYGIGSQEWNWDEMQGELAKFKSALGKPGLTDSFLLSFRCPSRRLDWTDDAGWARIARNMRLAARFARESGAVGLVIDHEDYPKQRQFERLATDLPIRELAALVRRRGREVFAAVFEEYPNAKLLFFWFMTEHARYLNGVESPLRALADSGKLWAFFANGILDVLPPEAGIIDGNEHSYQYESAWYDYLQQAAALRDMDGFCAPSNREKYRRQVQASGALYLDMYVQTNTASAWYKGPSGGTRLGMLRRDLKQLLDASDEYVWTWSERNPLVKRTRQSPDKWERKEDPIWWHPTYEEKLPGFSRAIWALKDPDEFVRRDVPELIASGSLTNLLARGFDDSHVWQEKMKGRSFGGFTNDCAVTTSGKGSVRITGVSKGCVMAERMSVAPGEIYLVRACVRSASGGFDSMVSWRLESKQRWFVPVKGLSFGSADRDGWRQGTAIVAVPEGVDAMVLSVSVTQDEGETCWADGAEIYRIQ